MKKRNINLENALIKGRGKEEEPEVQPGVKPRVGNVLELKGKISRQRSQPLHRKVKIKAGERPLDLIKTLFLTSTHNGPGVVLAAQAPTLGGPKSKGRKDVGNCEWWRMVGNS